MRRLAAIAATLTLFGQAVAGCLAGVPPLECCIRAAAGWAIMFVVVLIAGRLVVNIMVDALMDQASSRRRGDGQ
jgi:hypothetical protein